MQKLKDLPVPLHFQLSEILQGEINSGKYTQGDLFATERSLMDRFSLSCTTVRRALQTLVQQGYLYRKVGKGTFVRRPQFVEPLGPLSSFFEDMAARGLKPTSDVLIMKVLKADPSIATKLQILEDEAVYYIKKLQRADGEPIAVFESYWLRDVGEIFRNHDLRVTPMFKIVEDELGIRLGEAEATIEAGMVGARDARLLGIAKGKPVLIMERVVYTWKGNRSMLPAIPTGAINTNILPEWSAIH